MQNINPQNINYIDRNNQRWSIEKGDWCGYQYEDEKVLKTKESKKKLYYTLMLLPLLVILTAITIFSSI